MQIENSLFTIPILVGIIFVVVGFIMLKFPPRKINSFYGYRTPSSMKSQERWDFAHKFSSKELIKLGVLLALSGLIGFLFQPNENVEIVLSLVILFSVIVALIVRVELAIKKKFS